MLSTLYAIVRPSDCLSHTGGSYKNGWSQDYEIFTIWKPHASSFCEANFIEKF